MPLSSSFVFAAVVIESLVLRASVASDRQTRSRIGVAGSHRPQPAPPSRSFPFCSVLFFIVLFCIVLPVAFCSVAFCSTRGGRSFWSRSILAVHCHSSAVVLSRSALLAVGSPHVSLSPSPPSRSSRLRGESLPAAPPSRLQRFLLVAPPAGSRSQRNALPPCRRARFSPCNKRKQAPLFCRTASRRRIACCHILPTLDDAGLSTPCMRVSQQALISMRQWCASVTRLRQDSQYPLPFLSLVPCKASLRCSPTRDGFL